MTSQVHSQVCSQLRCMLFALIALPACGGDRPAASSGKPQVVAPAVAVAPAIVAPPAAPAPVVVAAVDAAPTSYSDALAQGKAFATAGDRVRARAMFEAASKLDKKAAAPHIELARLFIASGERALAVAEANKAVKRAPTSSQAYNTLGRAELARWSYDNAIAAFGKAAELDAGNVWAWNNLGLVYLQLARYQDAADALVEATSHAGTEGYMWNNLGTAYEHLDQLDDARAAFEAGGKAGSKEAVASRKRLEGVTTIVVQREPARPAAASGGYELSEEVPAVVAPEVVDVEAPPEGEGDAAPAPSALDDGAEVEALPPADQAAAPPAAPPAEPVAPTTL